MSVAEKLGELIQIKNDIKAALAASGKSPGDDMREYASMVGGPEHEVRYLFGHYVADKVGTEYAPPYIAFNNSRGALLWDGGDPSDWDRTGWDTLGANQAGLYAMEDLLRLIPVPGGSQTMRISFEGDDPSYVRVNVMLFGGYGSRSTLDTGWKTPTTVVPVAVGDAGYFCVNIQSGDGTNHNVRSFRKFEGGMVIQFLDIGGNVVKEYR